MFASISCLFATEINLNQNQLESGTVVLFSPPVMNKKFYTFELGIIAEKKIQQWNYNYNAIASAVIFEDWKNQEGELKAGGLGFKGGVLLPILSWPHLFLVGQLGFAKTALHPNPLFGKDKNITSKKDMFFVENAVLVFYKHALFKFTYQVSNVKYFKTHIFLTIGWHY